MRLSSACVHFIASDGVNSGPRRLLKAWLMCPRFLGSVNAVRLCPQGENQSVKWLATAGRGQQRCAPGKGSRGRAALRLPNQKAPLPPPCVFWVSRALSPRCL